MPVVPNPMADGIEMEDPISASAAALRHDDFSSICMWTHLNLGQGGNAMGDS